MQATTASKQETREAILWDILASQRICRCKIQGSPEYIIAHYPQNWQTAPSWLKKGTSITILHSGGDRGRMEVFAIGGAIPTPVSGNQLPDVDSGYNGIISGCYVTSCRGNPRMAVLIETGSFKISGTVYYLTAIKMQDGANYYLSDGGLIGEVAAVKTINAAPAVGLFRYDLISVGADCVIDYTAGTASSTPVKPDVASSHVALAYILIIGGNTEINDTDIGHEWTQPSAHSITMTIDDEDLIWTDPASVTITLEVFDQYNNPYSASNFFTLEIIGGNGIIHSDWTGDSSTKVEQPVTVSSYAFTYTRGKNDPGDESPALRGTVRTGASILYVYGFIRLYDASGNLMR